MKKIFILAVSGGVDSVVLLHKLTSVKPPSIEYIVAHVDHGIRPDSGQDARFVENLAKEYACGFELENLSLGESASEERARELRYAFLFTVAKKYKAQAIITAHHSDDVIETMIINILRGTGSRGLVGFTQPHILRPFMNRTKKELINYATKHNLQWREDSTNQDPSYLRNYVRMNVVPAMKEDDIKALLSIRDKVQELNREMDDLARKLLVQSVVKSELIRSRFVILPYAVQLEVMACWLRLSGIELDKKLVQRAVLATKIAVPGKIVNLNKKYSIEAKKSSVILKVAS